MYTKIMKVFYAKDNLPYKDQERQVHFPITGGSFLGASNVTEIRFYIDQIGDSSDTWVANAKLPNGKMGSKILQTFTDTEIGEHYAKLDFSSYYTQAKGDVYISLNGFYGGVQITQSGGVYSIEGIPTIQATGVVKIAVNYATPLISGDEVETITLQQIFAMFGTKLNKNDNKYLKVVHAEMYNINTPTYKDYIFNGDIVFNGRFWVISGEYPTLTYTQIEIKLSSAVIDTLKAENISIGSFSNIVDENNQTLSQYIESQIEGNIDDKVDKANLENIVYGTDNLGNQTTIPVDSFYEGSIVRRDTDNSITVPLTPTQNGYATSKKYVDDTVANAMTSALVYKGTKTVAQLNALTGQKVGDFYNVSDSGILTSGNIEVVAGDNVCWTGSGWDKLTMDLSVYDDKFISAGFFEIQDYNESTGEISFVYASDLYDMSYNSDTGVLTIQAN